MCPNGEWWFPKEGAARYALARAREVCRQCLVQAECLAFALDLEPELSGLWVAPTTKNGHGSYAVA
jgi:Transcription factor WhiB